MASLGLKENVASNIIVERNVVLHNFPHDGMGCDVMSSKVCGHPLVFWQMLLPMLGLLLIELNVVLMLQATIVVNDVVSLGAKMLCGSLLN